MTGLGSSIVPPKQRRPCPICHAVPYERCKILKETGRVRSGYRKNLHKER